MTRLRIIKLDNFKYEFVEEDWIKLKSFAMKHAVSFQEIEN